METSKLKKFAQFARRSLIEQVGSKLAQVLKEESSERRELPKVVAKLEGELKQKGKEQLIEQVAYVWFNRFCALRFMDVNGYNRIGVLSPAEGQFQPEILAEAKAGHIDEGVVNDASREKIFGLLNGSVKSRDGQSEAYRLLIVAVCNDYHRIMPYLFERIEDYTELLMPDDLLSGNSILAYTREAMTPEACESVECIGWLYQFYISEKKDQVFEGLKKNKKITPENIPAATQLFTPHWIVRYLVENSLGRLWMLNNPSSKVIEQMDYYIKPVEEESDYLKITSPEEIKVCDPACGSGHMLTYAYDLLYAIYLDAGYDPVDIPELILTKNLYGIEIDERAAELAAFALSMKALKGNPSDDSNNRRRFFRNPIKPNICRLESITFDDGELDEYIEFVGRDLFTQDLRATLKEFEEADNFGSLIQPTLKNPEDVKAALEAKDVSGQLFLTEIHKRVLRAVKQADYLSQKYHVVVANPPYMGSKGMNNRMVKWIKDEFKSSKLDLFAVFIDRNLNLSIGKGMVAMITMQSWMFLSTYEKLRNKIINACSICSLAHLGSKAFDSIGGEVVSTSAFVIENFPNTTRNGTYIRLVDGKSESEKSRDLFNEVNGVSNSLTYNVEGGVFRNIPGSPIAYWAPKTLLKSFESRYSIDTISPPRIGMMTTDNERFLRCWYEVDQNKIGYDLDSIDQAVNSRKKWFPYNKGGGYRKWAGFQTLVVNWQNEGEEIKNAGMTSFRGKDFYFKPGLTWSDVATGDFSCRYTRKGFIFDIKGTSAFPEREDIGVVATLLNSKVGSYILNILNPTMSYQSGDIRRVPVLEKVRKDQALLLQQFDEMVDISTSDWNENEFSFGFLQSPLLSKKFIGSLQNRCSMLDEDRKERVSKLRQIEEDVNRYYINMYGLDDVLTFEVNEKDITLDSNPSYKFGASKDSIEYLKLKDTIEEFVSYSVGCMMGRYALEKQGLVLAGQESTIDEYLKQVPITSFMPDVDNVIPMIDFEGDWFEDEISERFKEFLKVTFGDEHFAENLAFVEEAIGKDIKKYFAKDFYTDHVKRYKKRPIYWLFSSPKGTFNALIYMHRYRSDTVSVVLNDYLREFRTKLQARKESYEQVEVSASASQKEKTQAIKAIDKINKVLDEVNDYEREVLYPLAGQNIEIDLDDGVKHNYPLFGKALKKIAGLS